LITASWLLSKVFVIVRRMINGQRRQIGSSLL
jgi:CheY-like chemotaxis protein